MLCTTILLRLAPVLPTVGLGWAERVADRFMPISNGPIFLAKRLSIYLTVARSTAYFGLPSRSALICGEERQAAMLSCPMWQPLHPRPKPSPVARMVQTREEPGDRTTIACSSHRSPAKRRCAACCKPRAYDRPRWLRHQLQPCCDGHSWMKASFERPAGDIRRIVSIRSSALQSFHVVS